MPKEYSRTLRISELVQRELATLIQREIRDPGLGAITVSRVKVSSDLSHAKVFITVLKDEEQSDESLKVLNKAAGFLRRRMAKKLAMRAVPQLRFIYDTSLEQSARLTALIERATSSDRHAKDDPELGGEDNEDGP